MEAGGWVTVRGPGPGGRLGRVAPLPFVGAAAILVALIIFTPVLLATGPSPLAEHAELTVYRVVGGTTTQFYVHAVGSDVPYAEIRIGLGTGFSWSGGCPTSPLNWTISNETDLLALSVGSTASAVVVNATVIYDEGGARTVYAGEIAFGLVNQNLSDEGLELAGCPYTPGESPPHSWPVSALPLSLLLVNYGAGGPP